MFPNWEISGTALKKSRRKLYSGYKYFTVPCATSSSKVIELSRAKLSKVGAISGLSEGL